MRAAKAFPGTTLTSCLTKMHGSRKGCKAKNRNSPDKGCSTADFNAGIVSICPATVNSNPLVWSDRNDDGCAGITHVSQRTSPVC